MTCRWNCSFLTPDSTFSSRMMFLLWKIIVSFCVICFELGLIISIEVDKRPMVSSKTDVEWSLKVVLVTICITVASVCHPPHSGRLPTVLWTLNFWITHAAVVTKTFSCLEMNWRTFSRPLCDFLSNLLFQFIISFSFCSSVAVVPL